MKNVTMLVLLIIIVIGACATKAESPIVGRWQLAERGIDKDGNPCPFVPDEIEFFRDGTVAMQNAPAGMKMFYMTALNEEDAKQVMAKFSHLKDRSRILMMGPSQTDLINRAMAYDYSVAQNELVMALPGWTASRYSRVK